MASLSIPSAVHAAAIGMADAVATAAVWVRGCGVRVKAGVNGPHSSVHAATFQRGLLRRDDNAASDGPRIPSYVEGCKIEEV